LNGRLLRDLARQRIHHGEDQFVNPVGIGREGRLWQVLSWKLFHKNEFRRDFGDEKVVPVEVDWESIRQHRGLSVTFLKHASLMIRDNGRCLLIDPVFNDIFWFIKDFSPLQTAGMPAVDEILITHGHYDHLDMASLGSIPADTHVITPLGYNEEFNALKMSNRSQLDWYDSIRSGGAEITLLPCNHWTMRNPLTGPNRSLWGSYLIRTAAGLTIYISGDTAYFDGFSQIGSEYQIDLAIFNLGAYEPRWFMAPSHTNPAETVQAFRELNAKKLMIVHWGTFRLGDEPVHFPPRDIRSEMQKAGLLDRLVTFNHGQTLFL
jgi:L-ascorbate metabolism protein UlaG (beta-lactamase superfamily)